MRNKKTLFGLLLLVGVLVLGVGYAFTTQTLTVDGSIKTNADNSNFKVYFSDKNDSDEGLTIELNDSNTTSASFKIAEGRLKTVGDTVSGTLTIKNGSNEGIIAEISKINGQSSVSSYTLNDSEINYYYFTGTTKNSQPNTEAKDTGFYKVTVSTTDDVTRLEKDSTATYTIEVELVKAPLCDVESDFTISFSSDVVID